MDSFTTFFYTCYAHRTIMANDVGSEYSRDFARQNSTVTRRQCDGHLGTSADARARARDACAAPAAGGQDVEVDLSTEIIKQHFQVSST